MRDGQGVRDELEKSSAELSRIESEMSRTEDSMAAAQDLNSKVRVTHSYYLSESCAHHQL